MAGEGRLMTMLLARDKNGWSVLARYTEAGEKHSPEVSLFRITPDGEQLLATLPYGSIEALYRNMEARQDFLF